MARQLIKAIARIQMQVPLTLKMPLKMAQCVSRGKAAWMGRKRKSFVLCKVASLYLSSSWVRICIYSYFHTLAR
jgi:hypothetical protein